jgi:hypothetical protein
MVEEEYGNFLASVTLRWWDFTSLIFLVGVGIPILDRSGRSTLQGEMGASLFSGFYVWPLCGSGALTGKKSTPSVG